MVEVMNLNQELLLEAVELEEAVMVHCLVLQLVGQEQLTLVVEVVETEVLQVLELVVLVVQE